MNAIQEEVKHLLEKVRESAATEEDCTRLLSLLNGSDSDEIISYANKYYEDQKISFDQSDSLMWKSVFKEVVGIDKGSVVAKAKDTVVISFFRSYGAVASIAALLLLATSIYFWNRTKVDRVQVSHKTEQQEIQPGRDGAILMLSDGSKILLDTIQNGVVALQGGVIAKVENGGLVYEGKGSGSVYNVVETPKGRVYNLVLPDGSRVWLNSMSSIRYPISFAGKERRVEVEGEVYFEVAKIKDHPFLVKINDHTMVEVLGTHFNINSYSNESSINTTLLEGSIMINARNDRALLKPGQQAQIKDRINVYDDVDIDRIMAWKNGLFDLDGLSVTEVMRQLERWYDIDVIYNGEVNNNIKFVGGISKGVTLNQLLEAWEVMDIHFQLDGKKLTITP